MKTQNKGGIFFSTRSFRFGRSHVLPHILGSKVIKFQIQNNREVQK